MAKAYKMPKWARELLAKILKEENRVRPPLVIWKSKFHTGKHSSGVTYQGINKIILKAGKSKKDQKLVLLHELAHWLLPIKEHHSDLFWEKAFELYRANGIGYKYAVRRERGYKKRSAIVFKRLKKEYRKN